MEERYVQHPKFGRGKVIDTRNNDFMLHVIFDCGASMWIRLDKITEAVTEKKITTISAVEPSGPRTNSTTSKDNIIVDDIGIQENHDTTSNFISSSHSRFFYRKMIEAFRLGIVPQDCIQDFMVGREREIRDLNAWLDSENDGSLILRGEYGSGKTHFIQYASHYAMKKGYAVTSIDMDPNETPFHKPKSIYAKIIRNLRYLDPVHNTTRNFRDLVQMIVSQGVLKKHQYFGCLNHKSLENDYVWEWIEGRSALSKPWISEYMNASFVPSLFDYGTAINIYCYLLTGLSWGAMQTLGLKGLLVIFDEAEIVDTYCYRSQIERSHNSLKAFIMSSNNDKMLLNPPSHTGLAYCRVGIGSRIPFIYKLPCGLKFMFALTPSCIIEESYMNRITQIDLQSLNDNALLTIINKIKSIYKGAYDFSNHNSKIESFLRQSDPISGKTRYMVKGAVEALDIERLNPSWRTFK